MSERDSNPNLNGKTPPYGYKSPRTNKSGNQTTTQSVTVNVAPPPPPPPSSNRRWERAIAEMPRPTGVGWATILLCIALGIAGYYRTELFAKLAEIVSKENPDP